MVIFQLFYAGIDGVKAVLNSRQHYAQKLGPSNQLNRWETNHNRAQALA
jgi:hypothetical protein